MKSPVVLFLFKRSSTLKLIFERIRDYNPDKIYLLGDGPRNSLEEEQVTLARQMALSYIDWDCEVITKFEETNIGVYRNIGLGAKWVFEREDVAIFLEDDNLPETTFFNYCDELLSKYSDERRVVWICGTNYLHDTSNKTSASYYFTRHLLPCGWASWGSKFREYYDGELRGLDNDSIARMKSTYLDKRLFKQELQTVKQTLLHLRRDLKLVSWDRQMCFSVRSNLLYGIAPTINQIKNIGVDELSTHGGNSMKIEMTSRFCEVDTKKIEQPLVHPEIIEIDKYFESKTGEIILYPLKVRLKRYIGRFIKILLGMSPDDSLTIYLEKIKNKK